MVLANEHLPRGLSLDCGYFGFFGTLSCVGFSRSRSVDVFHQ